MSDQRRVGSVTYKEVGQDYFEKRGLKRHAAFWSLWSLGVAAVISGDFYGWNLGLDAGGFGGLLIATIVIAIMYYGLCFSIAEMSPALPHTGGALTIVLHHDNIARLRAGTERRVGERVETQEA